MVKVKITFSHRITKRRVIAGLRFIAENRDLSNKDLADGLKKLGCDWSNEDWLAKFDGTGCDFFTGMCEGDLGVGARVIINMSNGDSYDREWGDTRLLANDRVGSIYHYIRTVTKDKTYTKESIERVHGRAFRDVLADG